LIEDSVEIRRIEGILPIEGVNRDLPLKLENFSYRDMQKLLSLISKGEGKGNPSSEFENLLRATFLEYLSGGKGKIKVGDLILSAKLETDKTFKPGEEILLKVKNLNERVELALVFPLKVKLSEILRASINRIFGSTIKFPKLSQEELEVVFQFIKDSIPELIPEFKAYMSRENVIFSPHYILSLLALLKDEVRSKLKNPPSKEEIVEVMSNLISLYSLYALSNVLTVPVYIDEDFKGKVFYSKRDISRAFIDISTSKGNFKAVVQLVQNQASIEYSATGELSKHVKPNELEEILRKVGLKPVFISQVKERRVEEALKELLKGEGISLEINV
jgi:hypothetical protein